MNSVPLVSRLRRAIYVAIPILATLGTIVACGADRPAASEDGTNLVDGNRCATPNEGCDCIEPGQRAACGEVTNRSSDGFVQCSMGTRQCLGGKWGTCVGETDVVRATSFAAGGGLSTRALGGGAPCGMPGGGPANPCDPYCNAGVRLRSRGVMDGIPGPPRIDGSRDGRLHPRRVQ